MVERRTFPVKARRRALPVSERPRGLPHVYRGGSKVGRRGALEFDRATGPSGGRFRWLVSTCLAGGVGAIAIFVVIFGSTDRSEQGGLLPAIKRMRDGKTDGLLVARRTDGLKWSVPKADKLQNVTGAQTTRFTIHDTQKVRKANREYIYAKPYIRVVSRLAPVPSEYADVVPPFNPFKLYATERQAGPTDQAGDGAGNEVAIKVVELLGGILPGEDGQELDAQEVTELVGQSVETIGADTPTADLQAGATSGGLTGLKEDGQKRRLAEEPAPVNTSTIAKNKFESENAVTGDLEAQQARVVKVGRTDTLQKVLQQAGADIWTAKAMAEAAKQVLPDATLTA